MKNKEGKSKIRILGIVFICISILLSVTSILSSNITGAVVGVNVKSSLFTIFTLVFFFLGSLLLSRVGKGLAALVMTGATIFVGGNKAYSATRTPTSPSTEANVKITSPYWTDEGRFQRTYRWDETFDAIEKEYKLPRGILKGFAMQESYGDPLKVSNDGGAGTFMFQPRTAKAYGLKISGSSNKSSADYKHGKELKKLIEENKNNYAKLAKIDERFDVKKSGEAAAKYLKDMYKRFHSWDKVISAFNQGYPAPDAKNSEYVKAVKGFQNYYNKRDKLN